jgi:hypothetical protein
MNKLLIKSKNEDAKSYSLIIKNNTYLKGMLFFVVMEAGDSWEANYDLKMDFEGLKSTITSIEDEFFDDYDVGEAGFVDPVDYWVTVDGYSHYINFSQDFIDGFEAFGKAVDGNYEVCHNE